mgnify:CR=1 FL=1
MSKLRLSHSKDHRAGQQGPGFGPAKPSIEATAALLRCPPALGGGYCQGNSRETKTKSIVVNTRKQLPGENNSYNVTLCGYGLNT